MLAQRMRPALFAFSALLLPACWSDQPAARPVAPSPSLATVERPATPWPASSRGPLVRRAPDRCATVVAHVFELSKQELSGRLPPPVLEELHLSTIDSCHTTEWSDEILACYEGTSTTSETTPCYRSMTEEQRNDFEKRFSDIMQRHHSAIYPNVPPPPTP